MECPFRDRHTDGSGAMSFFASPDINAYHCFAGETKVPTSSGTFAIKDLVGKTAKVLSSNGRFVEARFSCYGKKPIWELHLIRDRVSKVIRTTSKHRWYVHGVKAALTTDLLKMGHYLEYVDFDGITESQQSLMGIRHGIVFGDGTTDRSRRKPKTLVNLHGIKIELSRFFSSKENKGIKFRESGEKYVRIYNVKRGSMFKKLPSLSEKLKYLRGFLSGYIATDGCFTERGILILNSSNIHDLEFCRQAFFRLGISTSSIQVQMRKGFSSSESPLYKITVSTKNLDPSFFIRSDQKERFLEYKKKYERNRWRVSKVIPTENIEDVYCAEVPFYHCFSLEDNILTGNCFSCKAKGNLVSLLTTKFGVGYFEAVGMVRLNEYKPEEKPFDLDLRWDFNDAPKDFLVRGFTKSTLKHFRIGMTEDEWILIPFYPDFNNPFELVGYQRRRNHPDRVVLNSKGFLKKNYLYNLDYSYEYVIVVEGYSDVMRLYQHGYNATGLLGADMSNWQAEQISKFKRVYLALDNDNAGRIATEICYHLLKNHTEVKLIPYETKDPGECISPKIWAEAFSSATDYVVYSMEMSIGWEGYLDMRDEVLREIKNREL